MAEPDDLVLTLLRDIRREMKDGFSAVEKRFSEQDQKFDAIRQALKTETIMGRYAINDVDDRLDALENKLARIDEFERRLESLEKRG